MALEKEDIMALIAILQKGLTDDEEPAKKTSKSPKRSSAKTPAKNKKAESSSNLFDQMSEKDMHKKDTEIDKKLWGAKAPTQRRKDSGLTEATCRVCNKTEKVSAVLLEGKDRYKCNKCSTSGG